MEDGGLSVVHKIGIFLRAERRRREARREKFQTRTVPSRQSTQAQPAEGRPGPTDDNDDVDDTGDYNDGDDDAGDNDDNDMYQGDQEPVFAFNSRNNRCEGFLWGTEAGNDNR